MASFTEWSNKKKKKSGEDTNESLTSDASGSTSAKGSSFDEWSNAKKKNTLEGWGKSAGTLYEDTHNYFKTWRSDKDEDGSYSALKQQRDDILAQADSWRKQYSDNKDVISYIDSVVSELSKLSGSAKDYYDFYSKFETEDAYKLWVDDQKRYEADKVYDVAAGEKELEALRKERETFLAEQEAARKKAKEDEAWWETLLGYLGTTPDTTIPLGGVTSGTDSSSTTKYDKQITELEEQIERAKYVQGYEGFMSNMDAKDYAANSQYFSTRTDVALDDARWGMSGEYIDQSKLFGDYDYDYINKHPDALSAATVNDTSTLAYFLGVDESFLETMTKEEVGVYNYLYKTQGKESADAFLSYIGSDLQGRRRAQENAKWAAYAEEDPFGSSVFSTLVSPLKGLSYLGQAADMLDDGKMEENAGYNRFSEIPSAIRSQVSTTIEKSGKWGKVGSFAYNTGMSMADFLFTTAVSGGNQALSLAIMGSGAAADATISAKKRGLEDGEAFALGTIAGLAEVAMEKISLGAWLEGDMSEGALRYVLKNALSEGGEEASTSAINLLADIIISGDKSEWNVAMQAYMDAGKSEQEAFGLVAAEFAAQIGLDALGGMLSGFSIGGGTYVGTSTVAGLQYGNIGKDKTAAQNLISDSLELNPDSKYAQAMKTKLDKGKDLSGMQVRNLLDANQKQVTAKVYESAVDTAKEKLTALGETKDVGKVAKLVAKKVTGQELTRAEIRTLVNGFGSKVAKEMETEYKQAESTAKAYEARYKSLTDRVGEEGRFAVSESGETTVRGKDGAVAIAEITKIEDDQVIVKLENGEEVDAGYIDFASGDESLLYSAVADIERISPAAATAMVQNYDASSGVSVMEYVNGVDEAYTFGRSGYSVTELKAGTFTGALTEDQMMKAYELGKATRDGRETAKADAIKNMRTAVEAETQKAAAEGKEAPKAKKMTITYNAGNGSVVDFDKAGLKGLNRKQKAAPVLARVMHGMGLGTNFELYSSYISKTMKDEDGNPMRVRINENGVEEAAPAGIYKKSDGTVCIDLNAYNGRKLTLYSMAHELTHFIQQWSVEKYQELADYLVKTYEKTDMNMHQRVLREQARLKRIRGKEISYDEAFDEVVANAMSKMLSDGNVMERLAELREQDMSLAEKLWEGLKKMLDKFFRAYENEQALFHDTADLMELKADFEQMQQMWAEAFVEASDNFQANLMATELGVEPVAVEDISQFSYASLAEAAGFVAVENDDGSRAFTRDGKKVSEVTVEDIENSPIGAFINFSLEMKDISKADADRQKKMFAEICTMACKTNDFAMTMQFVGSAVFTGMKANADKQYGTTYDFPSICTKTQAVIDAMSAKMMALGRGLTSNEIVQLYADVFASGNPVPCPECYVFSRWIGIGGLLDNIKKYQDYYGDMDVKDVAAAYLKMKAEVSKFADEQGISFGKAKGALTSKLTKEFNKLTEKIEKAENQGEKVKPADRQRLAELEPMMNTVKSMTWLENVYFADSSLKKVNPNFRVPNEVLFDLNNGEAFASQYKEAWAFRTTQGAGYGKAITPYAEARLGEGVLVTNNTTNAIKGRAQGTLNNYFLNQNGKLDKQSRETLKKARMKQKIQAFIGGQRFQSTSDARYENASDYLLAALEMQAMHGMVQAYTKVDGAVPAFSAWGFSINQSLMPLNGGLDANGNVHDTAVGGMKPSVAFENRQKHETAGTITIGVNDNHIRAMFKQVVRDFIIPYHASGGKADVVAEFRRIQEGKETKGKAVRSTDYSRTQSDKVLSDEVLRWQGKTDAQIQRIHEIRNARIEILTGGNVNMTVVRSNRFLSALYDKLHGGEWDGVKLAKSKVESQIFPNEFWDQTVTYEDSAKITKDYLEYCEDLGFLHRFSGMIPSNGKLVPANGYNENGERVQLTDLAYKYDEKGNKTTDVEEFFWKVLTDRRMYDNNGNYLPQKIVTLNDTTAETVTGFAKNNQGRQYDKAKAEALAKKIAGEQYSSQETDADDAGFKDYDIVSAVYDIRNEKAKRGHDLVKIGNMPTLYRDLFELSGDVFVSNEHLYQNMVSRATAEAEGRFNKDASADYHELGEEKIINAIEQFQDPLVIMESLKDYEQPRLVAILDEKGNDRQNLIAVMELYAPVAYPGKAQRRNHVLITIYEKNSLPDYIEKTVDKGRILHKKEGLHQTRQAGLQLAGAVSKETLKKNVAQFNKKVKAFKEKNDIRYSSQETDADNAPVFYSKMGKVVEGMKQEKFGASSVISMLRGRGVKAEEIRWSGIQAFLDGKKSVTKADLLEFIKGSMLQIEETVLGNYETGEPAKLPDNYRLEETETEMGDPMLNLYIDGELVDTFELLADDSIQSTGDSNIWAMDETDLVGQILNHYAGMGYDEAYVGIRKDTKYGEFTLSGGTNYRELLFKMPGASYTNQAMQAHWDKNGSGVLAHARMQDFEVAGKKMLFIEEIQSDWHNAGHKHGYMDGTSAAQYDELKDRVEIARAAVADAYTEYSRIEGELSDLIINFRSKDDAAIEKWNRDVEAAKERTEKARLAHVQARHEYVELSTELQKLGGKVPDAPFKDNYHEFVLKRLIRMAAEEGYDSIGWTTADIQSKRWSEDYAEGYRIEYDQDIPKFLKKYGKQWGAEVGKTPLPGLNSKETYYDVNREEVFDSFAVWQDTVRSTIDEQGGDVRNVLFGMDGSDWIAYDKKTGVEYDRATVSKTSDSVWSMDITPAMKKSVLKEGQEMYSSQETDLDSDGNKLTKEQSAYFAQSKVRDRNGNLLVVRHGTNEDFNIFDFTKSGKNGKAEGHGFYFSDDPEITSRYGGIQKEVYLNITKPLYNTKRTIKKAELVKLANALIDFNIEKYKSDGLVWQDSFISNYVNTYDRGMNRRYAVQEFVNQIWEYNTNDQDLVFEIAQADGKMYESSTMKEFYGVLTKSIGYDGIIAEWSHADGKSNVYVTFDSEQSEYTSNKKPTSDPDLRYSTQETDNISNRDLLAGAFEGIVQNSVEYSMIQEYKDHIKELNKLEDKLHSINDEIYKMRFTAGARDAAKLQKLESEAKEIAKEINRYDKRLLNMEASAPLRKVIERERKKASQKTREHVTQILQNKKARAEQTELRHKIRKAVRDLDKILNRGNKKQNVKEDMKGFVSKALELADYLFTDHISDDDIIRKGIDADLIAASGKAQLVKETEDILTKIYDQADSLTDEEFTRLDAKRKANEVKLRDLLTAQRNKMLNTPVYQLFNDLVIEYSSFANSKQEAVKAAYDPKVEEFLRSYVGAADSDRAKALQNMRVADMTTEELWKLHNAYQMVLHSVRTANKLFVNGKTASIEQMVTQIVTEFGSRQIPDKKMAIALQKLGNKIGWDYEKLYYALDRIGSDAFNELIMNLANSENIVMQDIMEAVEFRDQMVEKYGFNNWDINKQIDREFLDNTGKKFTMTLGQLMSLYAYSRREGAWDHIEYGGFVFGEAALTNPKPADSYKLSKENCESITGLLTKEQKGYVEDMQKFLSETMGGKGNEVSMMLYGIKMFGEKNYFPIHIAGQFKAQAQESKAKAAEGFQSMSNAGFTHAQNPNAKAPFVLEGFNEVWSDHVNEMSRYHGTVPALEDIRRVMNRSSYSENTAESTSVKVIMENHFGKEAVQYFDNLYREANSGAINDKLQKNPKKLLSLFRKNSVAYSLSVLVQQPASIVRAYAMIDRRHFGFKGVGTITGGVAKAVTSKWNKAYANAYNEMLKYAPGVTMTKEIGGFDTATGGSIRSHLLDTGKSFKQKWKTGTALEKGKAALDLVDDNAIANLPNVADKIAWIEIWNACKRETVAKHKDLKPNSEEFMQAVGERFTEVIRATQVYDSIFAKSPMLKSKNLAVQMLVSFMNEPNTVANMAESAVRDLMTKGNRMQGLRTAHVLVHSIIFTGVMKSIIYAMRDDDEDETYIEKYIESLTGSLMDDFNPLNYIPIARDVWSVAQGYDVERADMAIVSDAIGALNKVIKAATTDREDLTEDELIELDKKVTEASWNLVESLAAFAGIPVKNIRREINALIDHARIAKDNAGKTTSMSTWDSISEAVIGSIPFMSGGKSKVDKLYAAITEGDATYVERIKNTYKDEDAYHNAVRKALRENDARIKEAAMAQINGDPSERVRIAKQIIADIGKEYFDDVISAINSEISALTPDNGDPAGKVKGMYKIADFVTEMANGDNGILDEIRDDIISTAMANGKTKAEAEDSFVSGIKSAAKESYFTGALSDTQAKKLLTEYADMDDTEASERVRYWAFQRANPDVDLTEAKVNGYYDYAEPAGISVDVYARYVRETADLSTIYDEWGDELVSKREQVLDVIDSLPLTWQQKDALYLAAGYSESTMWDVPW